MLHYVMIIVSAALVNNIILTRFLGLCPFIGVSKKIDSALGMGLAVIFVLTLASVVSSLIEYYFLEPFKLQFLRTLSFILVIATLVQIVEMVIQKVSYTLYQSLGIYLPLITTNCAVLGTALLNIKERLNVLESAVNGFGTGLGFMIALLLMASIREKLEKAKVPDSFKGAPIALIIAGILSLAFMVFKGILAE